MERLSSESGCIVDLGIRPPIPGNACLTFNLVCCPTVNGKEATDRRHLGLFPLQSLLPPRISCGISFFFSYLSYGCFFEAVRPPLPYFRRQLPEWSSAWAENAHTLWFVTSCREHTERGPRATYRKCLVSFCAYMYAYARGYLMRKRRGEGETSDKEMPRDLTDLDARLSAVRTLP